VAILQKPIVIAGRPGKNRAIIEAVLTANRAKKRTMLVFRINFDLFIALLMLKRKKD
jgi:hypothetical protein